MRTIKIILLAFAFSSAASAATLQTLYIPSGAQKPAPMPAPAETSHYAAGSQGQAARG